MQKFYILIAVFAAVMAAPAFGQEGPFTPEPLDRTGGGATISAVVAEAAAGDSQSGASATGVSVVGNLAPSAQADGKPTSTPVNGAQGPAGPGGPAGTPGERGSRGRRGPAGRTSPGMSQQEFARFLRETGGPAEKWAAPQVERALRRGSALGGVDGRQKGAKISDKEWQAATTRQELAVVADRSASYAERLIGAHNADTAAHGGRLAQIPWIWLGLLLVLAVAIGGYLFPRVALGPRAPAYYATP